MIRSIGAAAILSLLPSAAMAQAWTAMGGGAPGTVPVLATADPSRNAAVAVDGQGRPVVAWLEAPTTGQVRIAVSGWDPAAAAWSPFGPAPYLTTVEPPLSFAMDCGPDGAPIVAYALDVASGVQVKYEIHVQRFDPESSSWTDYVDSAGLSSAVGGGISASPSEDSRFPSIRVDPATGFPTVAWFDLRVLRLKRWNGSDWVGRAGSDGPNGILVTAPGASGQPSLDLDAAGAPVIAYVDAPAPAAYTQIFLVRYDATAATWTGLGGSSTGLGLSNNDTRIAMTPRLRLDPAGAPAVAWQSSPPQFDGAIGGGEVGEPQNIHFRRWSKGAWEAPGGSDSPLGISRSAVDDCVFPSVAFLPGPLPFVCWQSGSEIQGRFWDEGAMDWRGLGGSELPQGLSATTATSLAPQAAAGPDGSVFVCWSEALTAGKGDATLAHWKNAAPVITTADQKMAGPGGAAIATGAPVVGATSFTVAAAATDSEGSPGILEVEARLADDAFTGTATHVSAASFAPDLSVLVDGWQVGDRVKWRAWIREPFGTTSLIVDFGANGDEPDLVFRSNAAPVPRIAGMLDAAGAALAPGSRILAGDRVTFVVPVDDPDRDAALARYEIRRQVDGFSGTPTHSSGLAPAGGTAMMEVEVDLEGALVVQVLLEDQYGARSAWSPLGSPGLPDLVVGQGGSVGPSGCAAARPACDAAAMAWLAVALCIVVPLPWRSPR